MNACTIKTTKYEATEGDVQFYDNLTNRFFVCHNGEYSWFNPEDLEFHCDIHSIAGIRPSPKTDLLDQVQYLGCNQFLSPDTVISIIQRTESEILHADTLQDMRRLEYENYVKRYQRKRAQQHSKDRLHLLHVPFSSKYHHYLSPRSASPPSTPFFKIPHSKPSSCSSRHQLLQWAYNHPNAWVKTFITSHHSTPLPEHANLSSDFVKEHDIELYTIAFALNEYGYSHLHPSPLLQDTLLRVRNFIQHEKYSKSSHIRSAFGKVTICHRQYWIEQESFRVGAIREETYQRLQKLNPAVENTIARVNGCDVVVVDDSLPSSLFTIAYISSSEEDREKKKISSKDEGGWYIKVNQPDIELHIEETPLTFISPPFALGNSNRIVIGRHEFVVEFACE